LHAFDKAFSVAFHVYSFPQIVQYSTGCLRKAYCRSLCCTWKGEEMYWEDNSWRKQLWSPNRI